MEEVVSRLNPTDYPAKKVRSVNNEPEAQSPQAVEKHYDEEFEEESAVKQWLEQAALNGAEGSFSFDTYLQLPQIKIPVTVFVSEATRSGHVKVNMSALHAGHEEEGELA